MIALKTLLSEHKCKSCDGVGSWHVMKLSTGQPSERDCSECKGNGVVEVECNDSECDECNPIVDDDSGICSACKEHTEFRDNTGSECCGASPYHYD